jgi:hypothetical protein
MEDRIKALEEKMDRLLSPWAGGIYVPYYCGSVFVEGKRYPIDAAVRMLVEHTDMVVQKGTEDKVCSGQELNDQGAA